MANSTPDYVYDPDDWEATYCWDDRHVLIENCGIDTRIRAGEIVRFGTLRKGPDKWAANIVLTRDEDGEPDEIEVRWFDSAEEARAALAKAEAP